MSYFRDISTFGGCAAGPAAALENMRIIEDEELLENTTAMGAYLMDSLGTLKEKHAIIGDVRGKGLFCGAELVSRSFDEGAGRREGHTGGRGRLHGPGV